MKPFHLEVSGASLHLSQSQSHLPHYSPSPSHPPSTHTSHTFLAVHSQKRAHICSSHPHSFPLTSPLLLPAQGLPSGPHQPLLIPLLLLLLEPEFPTLQPSVPPSPSLWLPTAMCQSWRCTKELQEHSLEAQRQNGRRGLSPIFQGDLGIWDFLRESGPINMSKLVNFTNTSPVTVRGRRICCQSVVCSFILAITTLSTCPAGNLAAIPSPLLISCLPACVLLPSPILPLKSLVRPLGTSLNPR